MSLRKVSSLILVLLFALSQTLSIAAPVSAISDQHHAAENQTQIQNFDCSTVLDVPQSECQALVALYNTQNSGCWYLKNWFLDNKVDNWDGVTVTDSHVTLIAFWSCDSYGQIPIEIGNLKYLETFMLINTDFSGSLPSELGSLSNLTQLHLHGNNFSGSIPASIGNLSKLTHLQISGTNKLTGSIPTTLGSLSNLQTLNLYENKLTGEIPVELADLTNLTSLNLDHNYLTGEIPVELADLTNLVNLDLSATDLYGGIPPQLGTLERLQELKLSSNDLTGSIPLSFINLTQLTKFHFDFTSLCEPPTTDFLTWKATVSDWRTTGLICEAFEGGITSPPSLIETGPTELPIIATAESLSGQGVAQVEFYAKWNGIWHKLGVDTTAPYSFTWNIPDTLNTQLISLRVDVVGNDGTRGEFVGGTVPVIYFQSLNNPAVVENYVLRSKRAYLNQRSLDDTVRDMDGDKMCGAASMAMVLAMEGVIPNDFASMSTKAKDMYWEMNKAVGRDQMVEKLKQNGLAAEIKKFTPDDGWNYVKKYIDLGHPLIMPTDHYTQTVSGHYIVIVGYKETAEGRYVIAYDPYGEWLGRTCFEIDGTRGSCRNGYHMNSLDADSTVGKWVTYNFDKAFTSTKIGRWPGYGFITVALNPSSLSAYAINGTLSEPDEISDEPRVVGTYEGVENYYPAASIYLPLISR